MITPSTFKGSNAIADVKHFCFPLCANCHAEVHDGLHPDVPCPPTRKPKSSEQDEPEVVKEEVTLWDNLSTKGKQK